MKAMKLHAIRHVPFEGLGYIRLWAESKGFDIAVSSPSEGDAFPSVDDFDCLVIMGGPMGANDEAYFPWIADEKRFIEATLEAGKKIIAVCLGAQIVADVLGGAVQLNETPEIGWYPIQLTEAGRKHPLFQDLPLNFDVFHWHFDVFDLPTGAECLASSDVTENQIYVYKNQVLATQCHLEITPHIVKSLAQRFPEVVHGKNHYTQTEGKMLENLDYFDKAGRILFILLDRFLCGVNSV